MKTHAMLAAVSLDIKHRIKHDKLWPRVYPISQKLTSFIAIKVGCWAFRGKKACDVTDGLWRDDVIKFQKIKLWDSTHGYWKYGCSSWYYKIRFRNRIKGLFRGAKLLILVLVTVLHCFLWSTSYPWCPKNICLREANHHFKLRSFMNTVCVTPSNKP